MISSIGKAALALSLLWLELAPAARATEIPVPTQAEWADAKKTVKLANGISLAYVEIGDSEGSPTLLIHGYTDNSRSWSLVAPYMKKRRLLAIDLRGHGKSDAPDCCYAYTDFADDASLFLDAMGIAKADVIGHSLGSLAAQLLAAQHPDKVKNLVLVSSTTAIGGGPGSWLWDNVMPLTAPIDPESQFMKDWYANPNTVDEDFLTRERTESAAVPIHVWRGVLWGTVIDDLTPIAPLVKAPVLVLWGEKDGLFDLTHQEKLEKAYPDAVFQVFSGAGHNMFWEFPDKAASLINDFLDLEP
ncbi:Pimeloyl-ACP methyl ester carboxylesterase [Mesorhizobium albiziae]|uniref:Pimeloyl-ACP methyl ester carboxylesterase n=1 Tax=Neomesorhizobium albiziae TaxID=335020 RepID=A0A1I3Y484_9HYPH|nr:alpha/beta hydrolase [Mesorhizobium albiziae]GLS30104.1 alpha/beta hydrolase [Mesorhizobium albiziae]SFK26563.1 Pimeloyl-ACP methyl ester carboxylesterase [Mesorhizobium albiziae]